MPHPNASASAGAGVIVAALIYVLGLFGVDLPEPPLAVAVFLGSCASAVVLLVGREGLRGLARRIWRGQE